MNNTPNSTAKYLTNKPDKLHPDLPIHRFMASALSQHFSHPSPDTTIKLTGNQPLLDEMKKVVSHALDTSVDGKLVNSLEESIILDCLVWPEYTEEEAEEGQMQVASYAQWIQEKSVKGIQHMTRSFAQRVLEKAHEHSSPKPNNIVGVCITTFTQPKKANLDFIIHRTFLSVNYEYICFRFRLEPRSDGFYIHPPKKVKTYPWHAHLLSDEINGTFNRTFNYNEN